VKAPRASAGQRLKGRRRAPAQPRPFDPDCTICPRLAAYLGACRRAHPDYHARPVPPFGMRRARLLIVGLAPGFHGANRTGRPFTGDHAGLLLYATLQAHGFANAGTATAPGDGLRLIDCRITNAVRCVPPGNRPQPREVQSCARYLAGDLESVPRGGVVLALGRIAHGAVLGALGLAPRQAPFAHGARHALPEARTLLDSYHCSRYNTQTGRLTSPMFDAVVGQAARLIRSSNSDRS